MATKLKRFTISITPNMEEDLNLIKKELYYNNTRNAMIRDLIIRGLDSIKAEHNLCENNQSPAYIP
jgi:metal-responsive CopG/Arc/MetJ family transcriptional regulator